MSIELDLDLQFGDGISQKQIKKMPGQSTIEQWVTATLDATNLQGLLQLTIRVVDEAEIIQLNETYRHKRGATNVLSFKFEAPDDVDVPLLGDIIICAPVVEKQAVEQNKTLHQHWAQMVVHGTLHLLGFDHISEQEAEMMEALEIDILSIFGLPNPYIEMKAL